MTTPSSTATAMPDVQSTPDTRQIRIQRVGIRGVRHPMLIAGADAGSDAATPQATVANWTLTVALPAEEKGTHMSRFVALLEDYRSQAMTPALFCQMARAMLPLLHAQQGDITAAFPYFVNKAAPVSGVQSLMDYEVEWIARADATKPEKEAVEFELVVQVPVTSLCPCSKTISDYGAHNQRSHVTVHAVLRDDALDDTMLARLIRLVEDEGSCELWGLLKRPDEKYVTEYAYDHPKFVEDLVRDVAARLAAEPGVARYRVEAENFESIHNHSAYAVVEG